LTEFSRFGKIYPNGANMTGTRERVLKTLLAKPRTTINELADEVGINPISIRHHIASLEAEGLVTSDEERHGRGRPRRVYLLTESGVEHFPTRYVRLTLRLLEQLKESMPENMVNALFMQMAEGLADELASNAQTEKMSMEERLKLVKDMLYKEGFSIEWVHEGGEYHISEVSCPYYYIGQTHPEVCAVDQMLISKVLLLPAEKTKCILNGDANCTYVVSDPAIMEKV